MRLLIAPAGAGKSHWLEQQPAAVLVACRNRSHRAVLTAVCDALGIAYASRETIDDLTAAIIAAPVDCLAFDDIDQTAPKLAYSLMAIAARHEVSATATDRRRVAPIIARRAAVLVEPPAADLPAIVAAHYPHMTAATVRRICATCDTPAAALHVAAAVERGEPEPPAAPTVSLMPLVAIAAIAAVSYYRYHTNLEPYALAALAGIAYYLRRLLWKTTT